MMLEATKIDTLDTSAVTQRRQFLAAARRVLRDPVAAQDAVQDAMLSAARNLQRFRGESQLSTWLGRIVVNAALTRRRALRRRPEESLDAILDGDAAGEPRRQTRMALVSRGPSQEQTLLRREVGTLLRAAIDRLPTNYRTVVIMRHFEDHHIAEIAAKLQITANAVKLRLLRAHRALRSQLMEGGCALSMP
jgi:RNA polymerase sigma-70 factor (ECF subfamily)